MQTADLDVIKDIPGYKVILKAVLRSQIQQLVEQLATHTEEESIILTASISDGTLCHLGSDSGKTFLEDHDDIKSQFLGFCLKRNHRKKQEKEKEALQLQMQQQQQQQQQHQQQQRRFSGMRPGYTPARSPRFASKFSPRQPNIHPVALSRASPGAGVRHSPYPAARPGGKRSSLEQQGKRSGASTQQQNAAGNLDNSIIKIEPDDSEALESAQSVSDANIETANVAGTVPSVPSSSQPSSPSQTPHSASTTSSKIKSESSDIKDDNEATGSPSAMQNPTTDDTLGESSPAMGLSLDSDLSNLISSEGLDSSNPETVTETVKPEQTGGEPEFDPSVSVKVEAISESDMELEITGVEPGNVDPMGSQDNWVPNIPGAMGYDPTGATGSQADMQDPEQGYNASSRFYFADSEIALEATSSKENESTRKKTISDMNQFRAFLESVGETRKVEEISFAELDTLFGNFLLGARKAKDNSEYEPLTLRGFMSSLDRYLGQQGCPYRVMKNVLFPHSNAALTAKQKYLKSKGLGNKPNEAEELSDMDIEQLFLEGILGVHSPAALINLLHLNFSLMLGMRGGKEQRNLKWGDIGMAVDDEGNRYLVHRNAKPVKTRIWREGNDPKKFKAWNTGDKTRCPVNAYEIYASKRPASMCYSEAPFFLSINAKSPAEGQMWYKDCPMGINTIYALTKNMVLDCSTIESSRKVTSHIVRKPSLHKGVDADPYD